MSKNKGNRTTRRTGGRPKPMVGKAGITRSKTPYKNGGKIKK